MKVCVLGGDGYCGWATALYLSGKGHAVSIIDNFVRRQWDFELGVQTLTPIRPLHERVKVWKELSGRDIDCHSIDITDFDEFSSALRKIEPEAIIHFAEQ